MPNRILKETICTSETIDKLTYQEEVFFYRLLVQCDDYGEMDARPAIIRSRLYPLRTDKISDGEIVYWLVNLCTYDLIQIYSHKSRYYLHVKTWSQHQRMRAQRHKYPSIDDNDVQVIATANISNQLLAPVSNSLSFDSNSPQPAVIGQIESESESESESNPKPNTNTATLVADFPPVKKMGYGKYKNVFLSADEYDVLKIDWNGNLENLIESMSSYLKAHGKKYKDYSAALRNWAIKDGVDKNGQHKGFTEKSPERQHTNEELQQSYDNFKG